MFETFETDVWVMLLCGIAFVSNYAVVHFVLRNLSDVQHKISEQEQRLPLLRKPWERHLRNPVKRAQAIARYENRLIRVAMTLPVWLIRHTFYLVMAFFMLLGLSLGLEILLLTVHEWLAPGQLFGTSARIDDIALYVLLATFHEMTSGFFEIFPHLLGFSSNLMLDSERNGLMAMTVVTLKFTVASILATEIGGELVSTVRHLPGSLRFALRRYHDGMAETF